MITGDKPMETGEVKLSLTDGERSLLAALLQTALKDSQIEEHRTRTPSYREHILGREELINSLLGKLGR